MIIVWILVCGNNFLSEMKSWIGGTDQDVEGVWRWAVTGELLTATGIYWATGEPNHSGFGEDCLGYMWNTGKWFDKICSSLLKYICESV